MQVVHERCSGLDVHKKTVVACVISPEGKQMQQRATVINRIQKVLEGAKIKLASVANDILGVSGRAMLEAMVSGEEDPAVLAGLARGQLQKKQVLLEQALAGQVGPHQRLM